MHIPYSAAAFNYSKEYIKTQDLNDSAKDPPWLFQDYRKDVPRIFQGCSNPISVGISMGYLWNIYGISIVSY
jgi:hypothetical protein